MKRYIISVALLFLVLGVCHSSDTRFRGGGYDGYDQGVCIQYDSNVVALVTTRFKGGDYDGYNLDFAENTTVKSGIPQGTIFESIGDL